MDDFTHALFLYAEAIRLLHTLTQSLTNDTPLPELLFSEVETGGPEPGAQVQQVVAALWSTFPDLNIQRRGQRYEINAGGRLVGLLMAAKLPLRLALVAPPDQLRLEGVIVQSADQGRFQSYVDLPADREQAQMVAFACLRQVLE